ncbi:MAG: TrkA C-terminal domain-containing protein [Nitrososphaeria archaeon]
MSEEEEEIRYKPITIMELLTEMHSTITLMIDLAYSAVLFNDKDLAEEVSELEEKVEDLRTTLLMNTAIVVKDAVDAESMVGVMEVGGAADTISHAAADIADIVSIGLGIDPSILKAFTKTQERLIRVVIQAESILAGGILSELELETNIGVNVIAIRRGKALLLNPSSKEKLLQGDTIIARGSDVGVFELDKLAKGELKEIPKPKIEDGSVLS